MNSAELQELRDLKEKVTTYESLLMKLLQWGHLDAADDGAYWRREINQALGLPVADTNPPLPLW